MDEKKCACGEKLYTDNMCFDCWYDAKDDGGTNPDSETLLEPDWVCVDCIQAIANDDFSALDYYYDAEESARREKEIRAAVYTGKGHWVAGNETETFSRSSCDCCGSGLAGERHEAFYIENEV